MSTSPSNFLLGTTASSSSKYDSQQHPTSTTIDRMNVGLARTHPTMGDSPHSSSFSMTSPSSNMSPTTIVTMDKSRGSFESDVILSPGSVNGTRATTASDPARGKKRTKKTASKGPRGRFGCRTCRQRHLKCDEVHPMCDNCVRAKRECLWNHEIRISHDPRSSSSSNRQSTTIAHKTGIEPSLAFDEDKARKRMTPAKAATIPARRRRSSCSLMTAYPGIDLDILANLPRDEDGEYLAHGIDLTCPARDLLVHPLEASLFQFYIEHAGPWLDITSPARHFASTIPRLALSNSVVLFACLAYAARSLLPESSLSGQYSGACAKLLIPLLSDERFVGSDETLLATLVILRHVEQYAEAPQDPAAHLSGAFGLVALRRVPPPRDSLPGAALWTYMRQDIRQALLNRAPPKLKPSHGIHLDNFDGDHGESSWADRACHLAALACTFAWGGSEREVDGTYLEQLLDWWRDHVPDEYRPYHESEDSIQFLARWHGVAWQFYYLGRILVRLYSDRPREMCVLTFTMQIEAEVTRYARDICKIAYSCTDTGCLFNASAMVGFVGGYFRDREDRDRVIDFLKHLTRETNWPTHTDQDRLRELWRCREV